MKTLAFVLAGLALLLTGCSPSNSLSREEAKDIIREQLTYPKEIIVEYYLNGFIGSNYASQQQYARDLDDAGLARASSSMQYDDVSRRKRPSMTVTLTEEGKRYLRGEEITTKRRYTKAPFVVQTCELVAVTGIAYLNDEQTSALVEYTRSCTLTPFAVIYSKQMTHHRLFNENITSFRRVMQENNNPQKVRLRLYDDGWRIAS